MALATVHDKRRDNPRSALGAWTRLSSATRTTSPLWKEWDVLATLLSDWDALVGVLVKKAELLATLTRGWRLGNASRWDPSRHGR